MIDDFSFQLVTSSDLSVAEQARCPKAHETTACRVVMRAVGELAHTGLVCHEHEIYFASSSNLEFFWRNGTCCKHFCGGQSKGWA